MPPKQLLSVGITVFNEQDVLPLLVDRLFTVLNQLKDWNYEVIFVNDGSSDSSLKILNNIAAENSRITIVDFSRNFGHQVALSAIYDFAKGDVLLVMDSDLQDEPELIPKFLDKFSEGYEIVYGIREDRQAKWSLNKCYMLFYGVLSSLSESPIPRNAGDFGLVSRRVIDIVKLLPERQRFHRGLRAWVGLKQIGIPVSRPARPAGHSKYSIGALIALAFDGIFSFSLAPIRIATVFGIIAICVSCLFLLYSIIIRLFSDNAPSGFTALLGIIVFISGVQTIFLGIIGEYVGRTLDQVKNRPKYIVNKIIGKGYHETENE